MKLFEAPALERVLLDVQAALARALAQAGLQAQALPYGQDLKDTALLLQVRRAVQLIEAESLASAQRLLALAEAPEPRLPRPCIAVGLDLLLGGIEPLRRAAADLPLRYDGEAAVGVLLARNLGLAPPRPAVDQLSALPELLAGAHRALAGLAAVLQGLSQGHDPAAGSAAADESAIESRLAHWRHRLPHLLPLAHGHGDPRAPAD